MYIIKGGKDGYRGGGGHLQTLIFYYFVDEKTQGKCEEHREKTGKTQGILSCSERGNPVLLYCCRRRRMHFQCKLGSETASMSSISSTDESFRWHGHHGHPLHHPTHQASSPTKYTHGRQPSHHSVDGSSYNQSVDGSTYNHGQQASLDGSTYNHGQQASLDGSTYNHGQQASLDGSTYNHGQQASLDGSSSIPVAPSMSSHSLTGPAVGPLGGLGPPQHEEPESDAESKMSGSQLVDSCL